MMIITGRTRRGARGATQRRLPALLTSIGTLLFAAFFLAAEAQAQTAYVVSRHAGEVIPYDLAAGKAGAPIEVGQVPKAAAITPDAKTVYVSKQGDPTLLVIDAETNVVKETVALSGGSHGLAVSPDGKWLWVANRFSDSVDVISTEDNSIEGTLPVAEDPYAIAFTPDGERVFIGTYNHPELDDSVSVFDADGRTLVKTLTGFHNPTEIAVTPDGSKAYVPNEGVDQIYVIDTESLEVETAIPVGKGPGAIAISPDGGRAFALNWRGHSVSVIDTASDTVIATIPVNDFPDSVAVTPDKGTAYVYSGAEGTLTAIDTKALEAADPVPIHEPGTNQATRMAITPNQAPSAKLKAPATAYVGERILFDATGSTDDTEIERYRFDFGDGSHADSPNGKRRHAYAEPGTYEATVTVDDGVGCEPRWDLFPGLASPFTGHTAHCNGPSLATSEPVAIEVREPGRLRLRVALKRPQRSLRRLQVRAICAGIECRARARGQLRVARRGKDPRAFRLTPAVRDLKAGAPAALRPAIPPPARKAAREALRTGGKVTAKLRLIAKAPAGQKGLQIRRVRIR